MDLKVEGGGRQTHACVQRRARTCSPGRAPGGLTRGPGPVAGLTGLVQALLEQAQALPKAAEGGSRGSFQEQEVLVQGSEGPGPRQRLDGMHQVLLLSLHLGHHLRNGKTARR